MKYISTISSPIDIYLTLSKVISAVYIAMGIVDLK